MESFFENDLEQTRLALLGVLERLSRAYHGLIPNAKVVQALGSATGELLAAEDLGTLQEAFLLTMITFCSWGTSRQGQREMEKALKARGVLDPAGAPRRRH